jgi:hypothetical protein
LLHCSIRCILCGWRNISCSCPLSLLLQCYIGISPFLLFCSVRSAIHPSVSAILYDSILFVELRFCSRLHLFVTFLIFSARLLFSISLRFPCCLPALLLLQSVLSGWNSTHSVLITILPFLFL